MPGENGLLVSMIRTERWVWCCPDGKSKVTFSPIAQFRATLTAIAILIAVPVVGHAGLGAYLASKRALQNHDFSQAVDYLEVALRSDPDNPVLMGSLVLAQLALGQVDQALPVATRMERLELASQPGRLAVTANLARNRNFGELLARGPEKTGLGELMNGLLLGWARIGAGSVAAGLAQFDETAANENLGDIANYHKMLALAMAGDFQAAEEIIADSKALSEFAVPRVVHARVEILSQLGRNQDALKFLYDTFGSNLDPSFESIAAQLATEDALPFTQVREVTDGVAEVFHSIAQVLEYEKGDLHILYFARVAEFLRPDHVDATLLSAEQLGILGQHGLAAAAFSSVPEHHPKHYAAELGRAEALDNDGQSDSAIEVLHRLVRDYPGIAGAHLELGNLLRWQERFEEAVDAYDRALAVQNQDAAATRGYLFHVRGICHERLGNWPEAESDFRASLALNPDNPNVLNYLGYSLVEKRMKLDEALAMIEKAAAARPESGYIIDSLGWVLFRLGQYPDAVRHLEKAIELLPVDPVINDHLGDAYWSVGRYREAEFQWRRALSFIAADQTGGEADPERIRRKLEIGLDAVLREEGAAPLRVVHEEP